MTRIDDECELIKSQRTHRNQNRDPIGLAFSGGGIRSATFNLGILQGLAKLGLLKEIDYLSTVSGGGYIGSWLTAWIKRKSESSTKQAALQAVEDALADPNESKEIKFLRDYSNYLTPKTGLLSSDTLTAISNLLRNLLLNQLALFLFLASVLLVPWLVYLTFNRLIDSGVIGAVLAGTSGLGVLAYCIRRINHELGNSASQSANQREVIAQIVVPSFISAALILSVAVSQAQVQNVWQDWFIVIYPVIGALILVIAWGIMGNQGTTWFERFYVAPALSGALGGFLFYWIIAGLAQADSELRPILALGFGTPLVVIAFSLMASLLIGLVGRGFTEENREWWGRLGGWSLMIGLAWVSIFALVLLGPVALMSVGVKWSSSGGFAWLATTAWGVWMGRSENTGDGKSKPWIELALTILPYFFVVGLLVLVGLLIQWVLVGIDTDEFFPLLKSQVQAISGKGLPILGMLAFCIAGFLLLNWRLDVNLFSMHHFYHNRLARCYLGASRKRSPSTFTGFDPEDEKVYLHECKHRPYHIVNTAINLVSGKILTWQQRKAGAFAFTPDAVGFEFPGATSAYQPTNGYMNGQTKLSTAITISGAAASPNMGYHSSPAMAFLLTVFNVRLGRWCANPGKNAWRQNSPQWGMTYLVKELLGLADEESNFVYLSDGGHFENLGIYELVRRRCPYIIACDAGQDAEVTFEDLGNAVRKCLNDFGVRIAIDTQSLRPDPGSRFSRQHCVVGHVFYPANGGEAAFVGHLFYVKASLTSDEPIDVLQYAAANSQFPHQSTADQWFDESQFESYRNLGQHIALTAFTKAAHEAGAGFNHTAFFSRLEKQWYAPSHVEPGAFSRHGAALMELFELLRTQNFLACLDGRFYPASVNAPEPTNPEEQRQVYYVGSRMIQLMENVYLDLNLEEQFDHPDHQGWIELFKCWASSATFRKLWVSAVKTYGQRFTIFGKERFGLP